MKFPIGSYVKTDSYNSGICEVIEPTESLIQSISTAAQNPNEYVSLRQLSSNMTLVYSHQKVQPLSDLKIFEAAFLAYDSIEIPANPKKFTWNNRYNDFLSRLKTNELQQQLYCLKNLISTPVKSLCFGERRMIDQLVMTLVTEHSLIKKCSKEESFLFIEKSTNTDLSWVKRG